MAINESIGQVMDLVPVRPLGEDEPAIKEKGDASRPFIRS